MTTIQIVLQVAKEFSLQVKGHCAHDVCVAVSALTNSLLQYADFFEERHPQTVVDCIEYRSGAVTLHIKFQNEREKRQFVNEVKSLLMGFLLYRENYPKELVIIPQDFGSRLFKND